VDAGDVLGPRPRHAEDLLRPLGEGLLVGRQLVDLLHDSSAVEDVLRRAAAEFAECEPQLLQCACGFRRDPERLVVRRRIRILDGGGGLQRRLAALLRRLHHLDSVGNGFGCCLGCRVFLEQRLDRRGRLCPIELGLPD
jgi:hypothetical protein